METGKLGDWDIGQSLNLLSVLLYRGFWADRIRWRKGKAVMRRVFYLITELDVGGAEKTLCRLVTRLDRRKFEPLVGCLMGRGVIGQWLEKAGVRVAYLGMRSWWDVASWVRLRGALKKFRPHVLHSFLFHANMAGRLAGAGLGIEKVICSVRVEEPRRWHLLAEALTHRLVDVVACVSASTCRFTHRRAGVPVEKLAVIPNGLDPDEYEMGAARVPPEWRLPSDVPVVAWIGRLVPQKDPLLMLRAAAIVARRIPDTIFVFAAGGPMGQECRAEAERLGLRGNVRWLGWVDDVKPLLARMNLLALSSKWEGMPNVALEAMACRKPVVATNVGGCSEVIVQGETGFLVKWGDAPALAESVQKLLVSPALSAELGAKGHRRVREHFSIDRMVRANQGLYA